MTDCQDLYTRMHGWTRRGKQAFPSLVFLMRSRHMLSIIQRSGK